jgi:hypothetical protein
MPVFFIANQGQAPAGVQFLVRGSGITAYFLPGEIDLDVGGTALGMRLEGADPSHRIEGKRRLKGRANFLTGDRSAWRVDVPLYESLVYRQVYPGIDMAYGGAGRSLKSEFLISPSADPTLIRVRYLGGKPWIDRDGSLVVRAGDREFREHAPLVYQESDGVRQSVTGKFHILDDGAVGFELGAYDQANTLVIDPVLSYSTLLGGAGTDTATALAVEPSGATYIAGYTDSFNFPTVNAAQSFTGGGNDVFVAKLSSGGNSLVYCTYLGGSADDRAYGIAVDSHGNAYVAGSTTSRNFPVVRGALQAQLSGYRNGFVAKLNSAGNGLVYSTYLGGNASDSVNGIAVDSSGAAYVVGDTTSFSFPASGFQRGIRGGQDAFVAKLSADGSQLVYGTYLGGSGDDRGTAIALDATGTAYVTGSTFSTDFPVANPAQRNNSGGQDAFVARLSADGNSLLFSTYLGGSGGTVVSPEIGQAIAVDAAGSAYVAGVTGSTDFPCRNAMQAVLRGFSDAFISKLTANGAFSYSTYLGGSGAEVATGIVADASGNAYVSGYTYSTDLSVIAAIQTGNRGEYDAFVGELNATGNALLYLSYLGGNGSDAASAIALDASGSVYVAGWTLSTNFPLLNAYQLVNSGNYGAFVAKMIFSVAPGNVGVTPSAGNGPGQVFSFQYSDPAGAANLTTVGALFGTSANGMAACAVSFDRAHNTLSLLTDSGQLPASSISPGIGTQQNSQCSLNGATSSVAVSGQMLTLNLGVTFLPAFLGSKSIYMQAANASASIPWQLKGAWSITFAVANVAVAPSSGSGSAQTFAFQFSDEAGANDLTSVSVLFNSSASTSAACAVTYDRARNALSLLTDSGQLPASSIAPGSGAQQNSQCSLNGAGSSVVLSGQTLTLNLALTFLPAFSGARNIYMQAVSPYSSTP